MVSDYHLEVESRKPTAFVRRCEVRTGQSHAVNRVHEVLGSSANDSRHTVSAPPDVRINVNALDARQVRRM